MRQAHTVLIICIGILVIHPVIALGSSRPLGMIAGIVRDDQGRPIGGALISLIDGSSRKATIRSLHTDERGNFYARNILPGTYRLRAEARGFMSAVKFVQVKPDVVLSLKFQLKRVDTLVDRRADRHAYRWVVRSVPRPILRLRPDDDAQAEVAEQVLSRGRSVRGMVQIVSGVPLAGALPSTTFTGVNFALAKQVAANLELVLVGQLATRPDLPGRLQMIASAYPSDGHHLTASVGYAQLGAVRGRFPLRKVQQLGLSVSDAWQVKGPLVVVYGVDLSRLSSGGTAQWIAAPRLGIEVAATGRTRLGAEYFPVSAQQLKKRGAFVYEGGEVVFADPEELAVNGDGVQPDRRRRFQLSIERQLDERSAVEAAVFFDHIAGRPIGLLALPSGVVGPGESEWRSLVQEGETRGARVAYKRRLTPSLTGFIGYAFGEGQALSLEGTLDPRHLIRWGAYHVLAVKLDAHISRTRTRISTSYRIVSENALLAIDPFYGQLDVFDPSLNIVLTQQLPNFGILPGRWEASVDARNLFDQQEGPFADGQRILLSQAQRLIRGSVSVHF